MPRDRSELQVDSSDVEILALLEGDLYSYAFVVGEGPVAVELVSARCQLQANQRIPRTVRCDAKTTRPVTCTGALQASDGASKPTSTAAATWYFITRDPRQTPQQSSRLKDDCNRAIEPCNGTHARGTHSRCRLRGTRKDAQAASATRRTCPFFPMLRRTGQSARPQRQVASSGARGWWSRGPSITARVLIVMSASRPVAG